MISSREFIDELIERFPAIRGEILDADFAGSTTLQMGCLMRYTQQAIQEGDVRLVEDLFTSVGKAVGKVSHKLDNSIYITYLGHLDFSNAPTYRRLLPENLAKTLECLENYRQGK